jgi:mono/diheme cytochrome c family protein
LFALYRYIIRKGDFMKLTHLLVLFLVVTMAAAVAVPAFAADGAAIYKAKCAVCHGAEGQGKVGPALKGTSLSAADITTLLSQGNEAKKAPHKKGISGLSTDDAKSVAEFAKSLK